MAGEIMGGGMLSEYLHCQLKEKENQKMEKDKGPFQINFPIISHCDALLPPNDYSHSNLP